MDIPIHQLKPSIVNALFPLFLKNIVNSFFFVLGAYVIYLILKFFKIVSFSVTFEISSFIIILLVVAAIPLTYKLFSLRTTNYHFYKTHIVSETGFFNSKRHSIPYNQITNINLDVSFWDKITKAGDIYVYTAQENVPSLVLYFIPHASHVERILHKMIVRK